MHHHQLKSTEMNLCTCVELFSLSKIKKNSSLGRKNFFPGQGEKINENILKIFAKIFGGIKMFTNFAVVIEMSTATAGCGSA